MAEIYVITGLMRSGTSFLASCLHRAGVPMGEFTRFPSLNPKSDFEWEDALLSDALIPAVSGGDGSGVGVFLEAYIKHRGRLGDPRWGVKCPFLLPFLGDFMDIAARLGHPKPLLLVTQRDYNETLLSLEAQADHLEGDAALDAYSKLASIQARLAPFVADAYDRGEMFECKVSRDDPGGVAERVATLVRCGVPA